MSSHVNQYKPCKLWHHVVGEDVQVIKTTPGFVLAAICRGNLTNDTLDTMTVTVITSRAINKMMDKPEDDGA